MGAQGNFGVLGVGDFSITTILSFFQGVYFNFGLVVIVACVSAPVFLWLFSRKTVQEHVARVGVSTALATGILLRILWAASMYPDAIVELDGYKTYATELAVGQPMGVEFFGHPTAIQMPAISFLMALGFRLCQCNDDAVAVILQVLFYVLSAVSIYVIGVRLFRKSAALIAVWLLTLFPSQIIHSSFVAADLAEQAFWAAGVAVFLVSKSYQSSRLGVLLSVIAGFLWGMALLSRATALVYVLAVLLLFAAVDVFKHRILPWQRIYMPCLAVFLAMWSIWIVRNYRVFETFVPLTTAGGTNLYLANNSVASVTRFGYTECKSLDDCDSTRTEDVDHPEMRPPVAIDLASAREVIAYENISFMSFSGRTVLEEVLKDRVYLREAIAYILYNPWRVLSQAPVKIVFLFVIDSSMLSVALSQRYAASTWPLDIMAGVANGYNILVLGLGLAWAFLARRQQFVWPERLFGVVLFASMAAIFTFYIIQTRYHTVAIPVFCLYAANALAGIGIFPRRPNWLSNGPIP